MKGKKRFFLLYILKVTSSLAFFSVIFPLFSLLAACFRWPLVPGFLWPVCLSFLGFGAVGFFLRTVFSKLLEKRDHPVIRAAVNCALALFSAGAGVGAWFLLPFLTLAAPSAEWGRLPLTILYAVCAGACVFIGSLVWEREYGGVLTDQFFYVLVTFDVVLILVCTLFKFELDITFFALWFLLTIFAYFFAKSQSNMDFLMKRRRHDPGILPRKVRYYSLFLISGICLILLILFLLREPLGSVLRSFLSLLKTAFVFLLGLLPTSSGEEVPADTETDIDPSQPMLPQEEGNYNPFWDILGFFIIVGILVLIYSYPHYIFSALRDLCRRFAAFLRRLLFRGSARTKVVDGEGYYEDDVQNLSRSEIDALKIEKDYTFKRWKKEYRAFKKLPASTYKEREGYRLAMEYLRLKKVPLSPADTPREIAAKALKALPPDLFKQVTRGYEAVRYGEADFDPARMEGLESLLALCLERQKKV